MGEKSNGGHVATGGARAVRQVSTKPSDLGLGSQAMTGDPSGGGGILSDIVGTAQDNVTDIAFNAADEVRDHHRDD